MFAKIMLNLIVISVSTSIVIILLWLFSGKINRRYAAECKYYIWLVLAVRLIIPVNIPLPSAVSQSIIPDPPTIQSSVSYEADNSTLQKTSDYSDDIDTPSAGSMTDVDDISDNASDNVSNDVSNNTSDNTVNNTFNKVTEIPVRVMDIVTIIWLVGCISFLAYHSAVYLTYRRRLILYGRPPADERIYQKLDAISSELNIHGVLSRNIRVIVSETSTTPMLFGIIRPILVIPHEHYSDSALEMIMRHELSHCKRNDILYKLFLTIVNAVHWFNPFVYIMVREAGADIELCCDADVLKNADFERRKAYSESIMASMENRKRSYPVSTCFSQGGVNRMKERFRNIFNTEKKRKGIFILLGIAAALVVLSSFAAMLLKPENPEGEESAQNISNSDIVGNHIYHEYSPSFIVDADITSTAPEKADILYAKYYIPNEQKMWSEIFDTELPNREVRDFDGSVRYDRGDDYILIGGTGSYIRGGDHSEFVYRKLVIEDFTTKYESWGPKHAVCSNPTLDTMYKKSSLDCMPSGWALRTACEFLDKLDISVTREDAEVYAIDRETMQQYQDKLVEEDPFTKEIYGVFKEKFEEADEFYILCFTTVYGKIPLTHADYILSDTQTMQGSNITIYMSDKGIFLVDLKGCYGIQKVAGTVDDFITVQEAAETAYKENVWGNKMTVDEIRFEYAPVPYNSNDDEVKLTPVWTFHMNGLYIDSSPLYDTLMIDAITGEKINKQY